MYSFLDMSVTATCDHQSPAGWLVTRAAVKSLFCAWPCSRLSLAGVPGSWKLSHSTCKVQKAQESDRYCCARIQDGDARCHLDNHCSPLHGLRTTRTDQDYPVPSFRLVLEERRCITYCCSPPTITLATWTDMVRRSGHQALPIDRRKLDYHVNTHDSTCSSERLILIRD